MALCYVWSWSSKCWYQVFVLCQPAQLRDDLTPFTSREPGDLEGFNNVMGKCRDIHVHSMFTEANHTRAYNVNTMVAK